MIKIQNVSILQKDFEAPLPKNPVEVFDDLKESIELNYPDLDDPGRFEMIYQPLLEDYVINAPPLAQIGSALTCLARGAMVSGYINNVRVVYTYERGAAYTPEDYKRRYGHFPRIFRYFGTNKQVAFTLTGYGRAGGIHGWDNLGVAIAGVLESLRHNFEVLCSAIFKPPKIPCEHPWKLPNMVYDPEIVRRERMYHATIVVPKQLVLPAKYEYNFPVPSPVAVFKIGTTADTPVTYDVIFWKTMSEKTNTIQRIKIDKPGSYETILTVTSFPGLTNGYISIEPIDAPKGMTVAYVDVFPMTV